MVGFRNAEELYQELQTAWSQVKQVHIDKLIKFVLDVLWILRTIDMPSVIHLKILYI